MAMHSCFAMRIQLTTAYDDTWIYYILNFQNCNKFTYLHIQLLELFRNWNTQKKKLPLNFKELRAKSWGLTSYVNSQCTQRGSQRSRMMASQRVSSLYVWYWLGGPPPHPELNTPTVRRNLKHFAYPVKLLYSKKKKGNDSQWQIRVVQHLLRQHQRLSLKNTYKIFDGKYPGKGITQEHKE